MKGASRGDELRDWVAFEDDLKRNFSRQIVASSLQTPSNPLLFPHDPKTPKHNN